MASAVEIAAAVSEAEEAARVVAVAEGTSPEEEVAKAREADSLAAGALTMVAEEIHSRPEARGELNEVVLEAPKAEALEAKAEEVSEDLIEEVSEDRTEEAIEEEVVEALEAQTEEADKQESFEESLARALRKRGSREIELPIN